MNPYQSGTQAGSSSPPVSPSTLQHPAKGFCATYGIHPLAALVTFATDQMLFVGELATAGVGEVLSIPVAAAVGFLAYRTQEKMYGDNKDTAAIKGGCLALLCAIPTGLPALLTVPAGILGLFKGKH